MLGLKAIKPSFSFGRMRALRLRNYVYLPLLAFLIVLVCFLLYHYPRSLERGVTKGVLLRHKSTVSILYILLIRFLLISIIAYIWIPQLLPQLFEALEFYLVPIGDWFRWLMSTFLKIRFGFELCMKICFLGVLILPCYTCYLDWKVEPLFD